MATAGIEDDNKSTMPPWARVRSVAASSSYLREYSRASVTAAFACATASATAVLVYLERYLMASWFAIAMVLLATAVYVARSWHVEKHAKVALLESERRLQEIYDRAGISIWQEDWSAVGTAILELRSAGIVDIAGWYANRPEDMRTLHAQVVITDVNSYSAALMHAENRAQLTGSLAEILPGSINTFGRWLQALSSGDDVYIGESRIQRINGERLDCLVTAALPVDLEGFSNIHVSIIEITQYKADQARLEHADAALARAQRIAAIGALTASIAHEINSPLAAIAANAGACFRWLDREVPDLQEARAAAQAVMAESTRARAVIDRAHAILIQAPSQDSEFDLGAVVRTACASVEPMAVRFGITIVVQIDEALQIDGDPMQIEQVLINLMLNGIQAMANIESTGELTVRAMRCDRFVSIDVADTGLGMTPEVAAACFDPFYSTKGDGMGMGLAICRSCVEAHGGRIWATAVTGEGATFHLTLPRALRS